MKHWIELILLAWLYRQWRKKREPAAAGDLVERLRAAGGL